MKALLTLLAVLAIVVPASALTVDFGAAGQAVTPGADSFAITGVAASFSQSIGSNLVTITAQDDHSAGGVGLPILYGRDDSSIAGLGTAYQSNIRIGACTSMADPLGTLISQYTANYMNERTSLKIEVAGLAASTTYDVGLGYWYKWANPQPMTLSGIGTTVSASFGWNGVPDATLAANQTNMNGQFATDAQGVLTLTLAFDNPTGAYAGDQIMGIGLLSVVPEPATMVLLVLGGLAAIRRRR